MSYPSIPGPNYNPQLVKQAVEQWIFQTRAKAIQQAFQHYFKQTTDLCVPNHQQLSKVMSIPLSLSHDDACKVATLAPHITLNFSY